MTWVLRTTLTTDELNLHLAALEDAGLLGIEEQDGRASAWFPQRADLVVPGTWEEVADQEWNAEARRYLTPVRVGGLVVTPPWATADVGDALAVVIDPGQAFGTGHHETTTGCLAALQEVEVRGRSVLDVGTGSGVLAIAAALLGADPVVAVDTDPLAVTATQENAAANGVSVRVHEGGADTVADTFDVVLANLDTATITLVARDIAACLHPRSTLIASGISVPRLDEALGVFEAAGLTMWPRPGQDWVVLVGGLTAEMQ